ncbi:BMP family ABC transporter substrate-binding protein, partial [Rhizobium johnstonii]
AIERMARSGCSLIFTTSFVFMDPTIAVAKKFPKVKFEHATVFKAADNVATYNSRFNEGAESLYLVFLLLLRIGKLQ